MAWSLSSLTPPPHPTPPTSSAGIHPSSTTQGLGLQSQGTFTGCPLCLERAPPCLLLAGYLTLQTSAQAAFAVGLSWPLDLRSPAPSLLIAPLLSRFSAPCFQGIDHFLSFDKFLLVYTFVFFPPPTLSLTEHKLQASQEFFPLFLFLVCCPKSESKRRASTDLCSTNAWIKHDSFYFLSFTSSFLQFPSPFFFLLWSIRIPQVLLFASDFRVRLSLITSSEFCFNFAHLGLFFFFNFPRPLLYSLAALCFAYTCV